MTTNVVKEADVQEAAERINSASLSVNLVAHLYMQCLSTIEAGLSPSLSMLMALDAAPSLYKEEAMKLMHDTGCVKWVPLDDLGDFGKQTLTDLGRAVLPRIR